MATAMVRILDISKMEDLLNSIVSINEIVKK